MRAHLLAAMVLVLLGSMAFPWRGSASPDAGTVCSVDAPADVRPDGSYGSLDLRCDLDGSEGQESRVTVVMRDGGSQSEVEWYKGLNLSNHVWLFDYQADGQMELVVDFYSDEQGAYADLFETNRLTGFDRSAEQVVAWLGAAKPTVKVLAKDGWWIRDGVANYNLDLGVDGPVVAIPATAETLAGVYPHDGGEDITIQVRDTDGDGRPDFDFRRRAQLAAEQERALSLAISFLMVNAEDNEAPIEAVFPWPFLGNVTYGYLTSAPHEVSQPPIQMDWEQGRIRAVGEFVSSRGNDGQWFVYSINPIRPGRLNAPNFEAPFAWYDLAADRDRQPELSIRFGYYPPNDPVFVGGSSDDAVDILRYSWDQDNDGLWDYKLGLLGKHPVTSTVSLGDIGLQLVPYAHLPGWVNARQWGAVTFVVSENGGVTGEGIYVWDHPAWFTQGYFLGREDAPIPPQGRQANGEFGHGTIPVGFRGEYNSAYLDKVTLYYSPVDQRLHLKGLEAGLWNVDARQTLRYYALHGPFVDRWELHRDGELVQRSDYLSGYLLTGDGARLQVTKTPLPLSAAEFPPPASPDDWQRLAQLLPGSPGAPGMPPLESEGNCRYSRVRIDHARPTAAGFRFELHVDQGAAALGEDCLSIAGLAPGAYIVAYTQADDAFHAAPARPASSLVLEFAPLSAPAPFVPTALRLRLRNPGDIDLDPLRLQLTDAAGRSLDEETLPLPAGITATAWLSWTPEDAGEHALLLTALDGSGKQVMLHRAVIIVPPSAAASGQQVMRLSFGGNAWMAGLLLASIALLLAGLAWRLTGKDATG